MYVRFEGRVTQEFEVQARRSELWPCRDSGTQAGIRCLGRRKFVVGESPPIADAFRSNTTKGAEKGAEEGWKSMRVGGSDTGSTAYLRRRHPICPLLLSPTTTSARAARGGGGGIRVLHADDAHGTWCWFAPTRERHGRLLLTTIPLAGATGQAWASTPWVMLGGTVGAKHYCCA